MASKETPQQRVTRVARELGTAIRGQVDRGQWKVKTGERNEPGRHVWRFREGPNAEPRFLHVEHRAMSKGTDATARLLEQLENEAWLDRLQSGPDAALLLSTDGRLTPFTRG